ncbi:MAG: regulatory iron-sulfur-containing complex subunit RicT [Phycisphaerae bacterium]
MVEPATNLDEFSDEPPEERVEGSCGMNEVSGNATRSDNASEKVYPTTAIRFGYMRYIGEFTYPADMKFAAGAKIVIQTQRGIEIGRQVSLICVECEKPVTREQVKEWVGRSGEDTYIFNAGRILREATAADLAEYARIQAGCRQKRDFAQQVADGHRLPLKVVECECPFGGERIVFYFTAAERVDFRGMVKDLAMEYRTRIEMRQIGARDEARLLADYETCGREVCCKVFLKTLKPISMRMAKLQKATLDPSQVSGRCGRLKCCLRYEHLSYEELDRKLPRVGVRIRTNHGEGVVVNRHILTQLVHIRMDNDAQMAVAAEDITDVDVKPAPAEVKSSEPARSGSRGVKRSEAAATATTVKEAGSAPKPESAPGKPSTKPSKRTKSRPRLATAPEAPDGNQKKEGEQLARRRRRGRRKRRKNTGDAGGFEKGPPPPTEA